MATLDYASIMRGGQALVPNMREQMMQRELLDLQRGQAEVQQQGAALKQAETLREIQRQEAFQRDLDAALLDGSPQAIQRLMLRYPELASDIKPAWEAMDERQRQTDLTQIGTIFARANAGDIGGAAAALRERIQADREAGVADPQDEAILAGLESDNPIEQRAAVASIGIMLASLNPDKFGEVYGKINPAESQTQTERLVEFYRREGRPDLAEQVMLNEATDIVVGEPGAPIMTKEQALALARGGGGVPTTGGGGPVSTAVPATGSAIEQAALAAVPGLTVTSRQRSPAKNRAVGGVANSFHLTDQARDFVPPQGMSMTQLATRLKQALPGFDVINEGDHVHVEPTSRGPVRVRSVQEARKLPPGTEFLTPDGRRMRVPG